MAKIEIEAATAIAVDPPAKNEAKAKKASSPRKSATHPPFYEMVSDAIATLKEKGGSSQYAIQKFVEEKHKQLPPNFRKMLLVQLKRFVSSGKLVKVKNSFKLPPTTAPVKKTVSKASEKPKAKTVKPKVAKASAVTSPSKKAPKKVVAKPKKMKRLSAVKSPAMKKTASPAKKAIATAKKIKKLSAVKSPAKKAAK